MPRERDVSVFSPAVLIGGGLAGVLAGILMGVAASIYAALTGAGWSTPMQMIAGTFYGPMAFVGGAGVTTIGVFTHLATSGGFGIIFAALTKKIHRTGMSFLIGIPYAIAVWAVMTFVTLAVINETMQVRVAIFPTFWFFLHWIFGGFLGLFTPGMRRAFAAPEVISPAQERRTPGTRAA